VSTPCAPDLTAERAWLEGLHRRYHHRRHCGLDPITFLYDYPDPADREIAGLVAAALAYGNVKAMRPAIATVLDTLGAEPRRRLDGTPPRRLRERLSGFRYRFTTGAQMAGLLCAARAVCRGHGSLEACFAAHDGEDATVLGGLGGLVDELAGAAPCSLSHLLPHPDGGSACKRLNLYLRWMVRRDAVDPGGWDAVDPRRLVMPLDTHVHRTALVRGWTRRRSADLRTALEITGVLAAVSPGDPLRYDFAVTRPGILASSA
jgi:uncharacterized protein (TIGR02757 family)